MEIVIRLFAVLLVSASAARCAEPVAKQFLRYIYGADGIELTNICVPSDDAWMLRGAKDTNTLAAIDSLQIASKPTGITSGVLGRNMYFIETRDGKVDPALNLDGIYMMHRQVVLRFIYSALSQNQRMLRQVATDASKVKVDGPKEAPPGGDMDVYGPIIEQLPVVRSSKPQNDAQSKTVTYRVPLGEEALTLTLVKDGSTWKVDTSKSVRVSLEFFYREGQERQESHTLVFELRVPKTMANAPLTRFELTTEEGSSGADLRSVKQREEGGFLIFEDSLLLFQNTRRALIVGKQPSQVFELSIPPNPNVTDWSQWRRPDYLANGDAGWDFMNQQNKQGRSTNIPPSCFQLHYKIEKRGRD
jgi:hypothetical protein